MSSASCYRRVDTGDDVYERHEWSLIGTRSNVAKGVPASMTKIWHCRHCGVTIEVSGEPTEQAFGVTAP